MPKKCVVLFPFPRVNSAEGILSVEGGTDPHKSSKWHAVVEDTDTRLAKATAEVFNLVGVNTIADLRRLASGPPSENSRLASKFLDKLDDAEKTLIDASLQGGNGTSQGWNTVKKSLSVVCSDDPSLFDALQTLTDEADRLYVRGHCNPGSGELGSSDGRLRIDAVGIAKLLDGKLQKGFQGRIKIFACSSAVPGYFCNSFALNFSKTMKDAGWTLCTYYGYDCFLHTFVIRDDGKKSGEDGEKAKSHRVQVGDKLTWGDRLRGLVD
jgi:hypothetical protein